MIQGGVYLYGCKANKYMLSCFLCAGPGKKFSRIFYFLPIGNKFVLLHGFLKKDQKTSKKELETALRYKEDYVRRFVNNG